MSIDAVPQFVARYATNSERAPRGRLRAWLSRRTVLIAAWIVAWNVLGIIRLPAFLDDPTAQQVGRWRAMAALAFDQTSWALVTVLAFLFALRARRRSFRAVAMPLAILALPLIALRYWGTFGLLDTLGWFRGPSVQTFQLSSPFHLAVFAAAAAMGFVVVYMERERQHAVAYATLRGELAEARLQALRLQLNPHFLFNALNSIASLVHSDGDGAYNAVTSLSAFLRGSLGSGRGDEISVDEELDLLRAYLEIELLRFNWLAVKVEVDPVLGRACVPAFIIQLLVENAIRHGLAPKRGSGLVHVSAARRGSHLEIIVADNGVGFESREGSPSLGIGLANARARLAHLYGETATLDVADAEVQGTVVTLRVPWKECPPRARVSATRDV